MNESHAGPIEGTVIREGESNVVYSDGLEKLVGLDEGMREIALQVSQWAKTSTDTGVGTMVDRKRWEESSNPLKHFEQAQYLVRTSDLVSGFQEIVEGVAFQGVKWESADADVADLFNQMAAEQNLDNLVRKMSREEYLGSQVITACWWDKGDFTVRGKTKAGNARKKTFDVWYPRIVTVLDNTRVVPVGMLAFGQEMLAWRASKDEINALSRAEDLGDEVVTRFFIAKYEPTQLERVELSKLGVDVDNLILLNPELVRRHTLTRSDYERWAPVRLRQVFRLLDLRQQLMEADRVALIGAANYILLVKKGDKNDPAVQAEVDNVKSGFRTLAKVPVIFSDHRLSIEIITPKQDYTLVSEKYDLLDGRIVQRLINAIAISSGTDRTATDTPLGATVVRSLENRRHMLRRYLEVALAKDVLKHPRNAEAFKEYRQAPSLVFTPTKISIGDEGAIAQQIISLRTMREISRESTLEHFGLDQEAEALRMELEEAVYDDVFKSQVPFSAAPGAGGQQPGGKPPVSQAPAGASGGRPAGGGTPSKNPTKTAVTKKGTTAPPKETK